MHKPAFRLVSSAFPPLLLLLAGCAMHQNSSQLPIPAGKHGLVHGGQQPVIGATIQLYAVGTTGDGSASTPLLSHPPITDANGGFNISGTFTCPSSTSLVYIVANGGNPGLTTGTNNAAISLMAALGPCSTLTASTYIFINELTTLAAVYPLAPYMASSSAVGSSSTDAAALANAFTLASEFVNTSIGAAPGTGVPTGTIVPIAQINTIGDIFAPCIDSPGGVAGDGSACGNLFALTTLTGFAPPTNTVAALLNLANNPTLNTASLYGLIPADAPFQPTQPQVPPDLSVRLTVPSGFTASPTALNFPPTRIGVGSTSAPQTVTFTNNTAAPVGINIASILNSDSISGADPYDFRPGDYTNVTNGFENCPAPVLPGATCSVQITFSPLATGARSAYLTVFNTSANPYIYILLTGEGLEANAGPAYISPLDLGFNSSGSPMNAVLANDGTLPLTIDGISFSNDPTSGQPAFTQTNNCGTSLAPQGTCTIAISALPATQIYSTGVLTVADDAAAGPQTVNLYYANGISGPILIDFLSQSVGTQGSGIFSLSPQGVPNGTYSLTLTGPDATDFSFSASSSSQSSSCSATVNSPRCSGIIYFTPSAQGLRTATFNLGLEYAALVGIGLPAGPQFSIVDYPKGGPNPAPLTSLNFPVVVVGQTSPPSGVGIINTGSVPLTLNAPVLSGPNASDFSATLSNCSALALAATCTVDVTVTPTQPNNRSATLTLTDSTGAVHQTVSLLAFGTYPGPVVNPSTLSFAYTPVGSVSAPQSFTITSYNNDPVTVIPADGPLSPFFLTAGNSCASTPCQISVAYAPTVAGNYSYPEALLVTDLLSIQSAGVSLSGISTPPPPPPPPTTATFTPSELTFGPQTVGITSLNGQNIQVENTGDKTLYFTTSLTGANPQDFNVLNYCSGQAGVDTQCILTITFTPSATGLRTATLQITSNTSSSPTLITLSGTGQ
jgi:hypothetical protein